MADKKPTVEQVVAALRAILRDVLRDVPCFNGPTPGLWTDKVIKAFRARRVPDQIISALMAGAAGYDFSPTPLSRLLPVALPGALHGPPRTHAGPPPPRGSKMLPVVQEYMANRARAAANAGNTEEAERVYADLWKIVNDTDVSTGWEMQHGARLAPKPENVRRIGAPRGIPQNQGAYRTPGR